MGLLHPNNSIIIMVKIRAAKLRKVEVRFIYFYFLANDFDSRRQTRIPKLGVTLCFHGAVSGALIGARCNLGVDRTAGQVHSLEPRRRSSNVLILEAHVFDFHW